MAAGSRSTSGDGDGDCSRQALLVQSLYDPSVYNHPVHGIRVVETHISYLILTGPYAYKIKKSVKLSFLDFSTLKKRKFYCQEELRLNQRLAPDLYLSVVSITGSNECPVLNGQGEVLDYAVKMVQFDTGNELDSVLSTDGVTVELISALAKELANFHERVDKASTDQSYGLPTVIQQRIKDNFTEILPCVRADSSRVFDDLETWVDEKLAAQEHEFACRKQNGFVRECHGDLHLGNMVLIGNKIRLFDCLEFNEQLRWIDVMSEIAFLAMDLDFHGRKDLAYQFLNKYLSVTGDYNGLGLLPLYLVYRAMVRAKVACIRSRQQSNHRADPNTVFDHLKLARSYTDSSSTRLVITHGVSGSGKTWLSEKISRLLPAIHIRSDIERMRNKLFNHSDEIEGRAIRYSAENVGRIYDVLLEIAERILNAGLSVIVDATFLVSEQRSRFYQLAQDISVPFNILDFQCPEHILRARIQQRLVKGGDASEATEHVLNKQLQSALPLGSSENKITLAIQTDQEVDTKRVVQRLLS